METLNLKLVVIMEFILISLGLMWLFFRTPDRRHGYSLVVGGAIFSIGTARTFWNGQSGIPWLPLEVLVLGFLVAILFSLYSDIQASPTPSRQDVRLSKPTRVLLFFLFGVCFLGALLVLLNRDRIPLTSWTEFYLAIPLLTVLLWWPLELIRRRRRRT